MSVLSGWRNRFIAAHAAAAFAYARFAAARVELREREVERLRHSSDASICAAAVSPFVFISRGLEQGGPNVSMLHAERSSCVPGKCVCVGVCACVCPCVLVFPSTLSMLQHMPGWLFTDMDPM